MVVRRFALTLLLVWVAAGCSEADDSAWPDGGSGATGGQLSASGGAWTGGAPSGGTLATGGAPTGGTVPSSGGRGGTAPIGGTLTGGIPGDGGRGGSAGSEPGTGGTNGGDECPYSGHITYTINRAEFPTAEQLEAYERLATTMDEALEYYNCYADFQKELTLNYNPQVPTAEANIDGWMSFSLDYIVLPTMMHEIAHTVGVGYYNFGSMSVNQIWQGEHANALFATIPDPPQPELRADAMHFWPYGLNYATEYESEADLIYHVQLVAAIREDLTIW